jgi:UDP-glucose 4-epimerase
MRGCDTVFHLAANADVRFGLEHPSKDLQRIRSLPLTCSKRCAPRGAVSIAFSSTGSVYGEASIIPTPEEHPFPIQTSLYAASKLAGEGLIHAVLRGYGFSGYIFRFVSILGNVIRTVTSSTFTASFVSIRTCCGCWGWHAA